MADAIHVLYVDDEPVLLDIGKLFLEKEGKFYIETIESAPEALELLGRKQFDAIISDYQMPVMDGIQFLIEVRARFGKIPFILFTGKGREEIVIQAINNGADFYLQKGGNPDAQFAELSHQVLAIVAQRSAEKLFRESENRYRSLVENMHDCVVIYKAVENGADFVILEFNHAAEITEKVTREEVIGRSIADAFPGVQEFGILDVFRRVWSTGMPESFPVSLYQDNRISGWRDNFIFKLPSGEIVASYSDETARKKAEEALQKSEEQYRSLVETTGTGYVILDTNGRVITANHEYLRLTGRSSIADIEGRSVTDWTAPYDLMRNEQEIERCLTTGHIRGLEIDYQKPDGTIQPIEINASVIWSAPGQVIMTLCWDITERKRIASELERKNEELFSSYEQLTASDEELKSQYDALAETGRTLRISEDRLIMAQEIGHSGSWEYDFRTERIWGSAEALRIYGFPPTAGYHPIEEIEARVEDPERVHKEFVDFIDGKNDYNIEITVNPKDGSPQRFVHSIARFEKDAQGKPVRVMGVVQDITERKKAEEAVRISRDYYLKLFDDIPNPIWRSDTTAKCDFFNKEWLAFTGRTLEQEMGDGWVEGVHPDDLERCMKTYLAAFSEHESFEMEYRIRYHDGTYHWLLDIGKPFYDPDANFAGYIGACYDITRRKKAEGELHDSRQILETIINTIPVRVFWKDRNLTFLGCNTPFARDAGFKKPEDILGKDDYLMGWREQAGLYQADDRMVIDSGKSKLLIEEPQTTPSGERICLLTSKIPLKDENGEIIGVLGTYLDITARKRAEEELRKSEEKYRLLIEKTGEGVWMIDKDYRTTFVNNKLAEMFGYTQGEMIGRQVREFIPADDIQVHKWRINEWLGGKSDLFEQKFIRKDGSTFWAIASVTPLTEECSVVGAFAMLTDIDERKRIEEALKEANRKLNILSSITRHDITNQLMLISGFLKILEKKQPDSTNNSYIEKIDKATGRIAAMIRFTQTYENVGVNAPLWQNIRSLVETAAKQAQLGDIALKNELLPGVEVFADPLIVKVFYNLMENAVRYGGKIRTIRFYLMEPGDNYIIVCEDDGEGIPAEEKEKIFDRGFGKNTGLGLFLAREILDITGITINETGEQGVGARFEMCIPAGAHRYLDKK
jgi:PAS domain S-box-containing protein